MPWRLVRSMIYGIPILAFGLNSMFAEFAPYCDLLDGPCDQNWATTPAMISLLFLIATAPTAVGFLAFDVSHTAVRRLRTR